MSIEVLKQAREALRMCVHMDGYHTIVDAIYERLDQAIAEAEKQEPVAWLAVDEREALERFNETCEDGEGYDVPKPMMRQLARKGAVYHTSRGIYGITTFGQFMLDRASQPQRQPLTDEFGITDMIDVGHYSLQLMFKSREDADKFKAAHGIKGEA